MNRIGKYWIPLAAVVAGTGIAYRFQLPPATGPHAVSEREVALGGKRPLTVRVWSPAEEGRFPLLIFLPAWGGEAGQSSFLTKELASCGYVVAGITPPAPELPYEKTSDALARDAMRVRDLLLEDPQVIGGKVGVLGHSIGGAAACEARVLDRGFDAALNMDGVLLGRAETEGIEPPVMCMIDGTPRPMADCGEDLVARGYRSLDATLARHGGYFVQFAHARHDSFADPVRWRWVLRREKVAPTLAAIRRYAVAFFDEALKGKRSALLQDALANAPIKGNPEGRRER